ncbi:MAG: methyltransferase [Alphaproteobacteria bacterium]|nr:methyltransferase [Alphaproteobacteria bacterium]
MRPRLVVDRDKDESPPGLSTDGALLDGRVKLRQPAKGYRVAIDPILLAAAAPASAGDRVLDLGAGVGAAALCLAARVPDCRVDCLEAQQALARLAAENVSANGLDRRIIVHVGDLRRPPPDMPRGGFDVVMTNPPYHAAAAADAPPDPSKRRATVEELGLEAWIDAALKFLKPRGRLVVVHRADRMDDLVTSLDGRCGEVTLIPFWPRAGEPARRVVLRARKGVRSPAQLLPGLVLHGEDGKFTPEAEAVLRGGAGLD